MSEYASRALIISVEPAVLELCQQVLQNIDLAPYATPSSQQAVDLLRHDLFDLVLLDLSGSETVSFTPLEQIRAQDSSIPIVLLTGIADLEHLVQATHTGAQAILLKPFSATVLRNTVTNVLQRRRVLRTQNRVDALRPLVQISERLLAELDLPRLYDLIIETMRVELKANRASLMLWDADEGVLRIAALSGLPPQVMIGQRVEVDGSLAGWVASHRQPLLVNSKQCAISELQPALTNDRITSALSVPMITGGRVQGVLNAAKTYAGQPFTEADQELLALLAGQAAIAIENARLYNLAQRRADRLALLYRVSTAVTGSLDLEQIIVTTMRQISAELRIDHGYFFLSAGTPPRLLQYMTLSYGALSALQPLDLPADTGIIGQVLSDGKPRVLPATSIEDATTDQSRAVPTWEQIMPIIGASHKSDPPANDLEPIRYRLSPAPYWLCVALASEQGICGAIELLGQPGQCFGEDDIQFMTALATPVAMAIEKAHLHASVAHSEARYRALLEHATEAVLLLDAQGRQIIDANPAAEQLSGFSREELLTTAIEHVLPRVDEMIADLCGESQELPGQNLRSEQSRAAFPVRSANGSLALSVAHPHTQRDLPDASEIESFLVTSDGRSVPVSLSVSQVPYNGQQLLLVMARDSSERQRIAQQLLQTEKLAAVGRLSASIAHEINNPLQAIHNSLHLLNNRPLSDEKRQMYLSMAQDEVQRLITTVQRMLDFYRPSRDGVGMYLTSMHDLLDSVLALTQKQLQTSHVQLICEWSDNVPRVLAIGNHLKQVFLNLILNAIESMPNGGSLTIRTCTVEKPGVQEHTGSVPTSTVGAVGHRVLGPSVLIEFSDTGQGIPPDILPKIFEPFYTTRSTGTGLGLAISYSIIEQHNGELSVHSIYGEGTTFRIRLPIPLDIDAPLQ